MRSNKTGLGPVSRLRLKNGLPSPILQDLKRRRRGYAFSEHFRSILRALGDKFISGKRGPNSRFVVKANSEALVSKANNR